MDSADIVKVRQFALILTQELHVTSTVNKCLTARRMLSRTASVRIRINKSETLPFILYVMHDEVNSFTSKILVAFCDGEVVTVDLRVNREVGRGRSGDLSGLPDGRRDLTLDRQRAAILVNAP